MIISHYQKLKVDEIKFPERNKMKYDYIVFF